jgi:hypothetical protein
MASLASKRAVATALAGAAIASSLGAPAVSALPAEQYLPGASAGASDSRRVLPPPSSIAASAVEEYEELRSPDATTVPARVVEVGADRGFDWGDAGIGATGVLVLVAIGAGAAVAAGYRPRARHNPQPIS